MKNLAKKAITGIMLLSPVLTFGQSNFGVNVPTTNITSLSAVESIITKIVNWLTGLFFVAAILFIFYAAWLYLTAAGDEDKVAKAKNQLMYSIVAIAVALLAGTMRYIVQSILS
ncbi:MAG: pilin [Patescibacteria group bacterium]|nr:pilin [Patescibacteria group bacterium]